jgi:hypothetical protein
MCSLFGNLDHLDQVAIGVVLDAWDSEIAHRCSGSLILGKSPGDRKRAELDKSRRRFARTGSDAAFVFTVFA